MSKGEYIEGIEFEEGVAVVRLIGSITVETLETAQEEFRSKTKGRNIKSILFDLKDVSHTDSSGIAALVDLLKYMKTHQTGGKIGLVNFSSEIMSLLEILKADPLFMEFQSKEEAIAHLKEYV